MVGTCIIIIWKGYFENLTKPTIFEKSRPYALANTVYVAIRMLASEHMLSASFSGSERQNPSTSLWDTAFQRLGSRQNRGSPIINNMQLTMGILRDILYSDQIAFFEVLYLRD